MRKNYVLVRKGVSGFGFFPMYFAGFYPHGQPRSEPWKYEAKLFFSVKQATAFRRKHGLKGFRVQNFDSVRTW
jgi:hypothetical protein